MELPPREKIDCEGLAVVVDTLHHYLSDDDLYRLKLALIMADKFHATIPALAILVDSNESEERMEQAREQVRAALVGMQITSNFQRRQVQVFADMLESYLRTYDDRATGDMEWHRFDPASLRERLDAEWQVSPGGYLSVESLLRIAKSVMFALSKMQPNISRNFYVPSEEELRTWLREEIEGVYLQEDV